MTVGDIDLNKTNLPPVGFDRMIVDYRELNMTGSYNRLSQDDSR